MKKKNITCCIVFLILLISPLGLLCHSGIRDRDIIINLIIFILLPGIGPLHAFYVIALSCCETFLNFFIPPLGVYITTKKCGKTFLCLILSILFFLPGVIYSYYTSVNFKINLENENGEKNEEIELVNEDEEIDKKDIQTVPKVVETVPADVETVPDEAKDN